MMIRCRYDDDNSDDYDYEVYEFCDDDDVDDGNDANDDADNNNDNIFSVIMIYHHRIYVSTILQLLTIVVLASKVKVLLDPPQSMHLSDR